MSVKFLREYEENGERVIEYTKDGTTVSHTDRELISAKPIEPPATVETPEEKIARLEEEIQSNNIAQFEVLATIIEQLNGGNEK